MLCGIVGYARHVLNISKYQISQHSLSHLPPFSLEEQILHDCGWARNYSENETHRFVWIKTKIKIQIESLALTLKLWLSTKSSSFCRLLDSPSRFGHHTNHVLWSSNDRPSGWDDELGYDCQSTPGSCETVCPRSTPGSRYDSWRIKVFFFNEAALLAVSRFMWVIESAVSSRFFTVRIIAVGAVELLTYPISSCHTPDVGDSIFIRFIVASDLRTLAIAHPRLVLSLAMSPWVSAGFCCPGFEVVALAVAPVAGWRFASPGSEVLAKGGCSLRGENRGQNSWSIMV